MIQIHMASDRPSTISDYISVIRKNRGKIVFLFQQKIVERFHRNKSKEANEDVAERVFLISDERINLTFHLEDNRVTASTREFIRPPHTTEKGGTLTMTPDMTTTFQVSFITACASRHQVSLRTLATISSTSNSSSYTWTDL